MRLKRAGLDAEKSSVTSGPAKTAAHEITDQDLGQALPAWAGLADRLDRIELARRLLEVAAPAPDLGLTTARVQLLAGRPTEAMETLGAAGVRSSADADSGVEGVLVAACAAANGNDEAFRALLSASAGLAEKPAAAVYCAYLVAAAAEARGDREIADQAWSSLVVRHQVRTALTVPRWAVAELVLRDNTDGLPVIRSLAGVTSALERLGHRLATDPQPALDAADGLVQRGDAAGARLLLDLLTRRNGKISRLQTALAALTPAAAMRRYRVLTWAAVAAWMPFIWLGIIWIALALSLIHI